MKNSLAAAALFAGILTTGPAMALTPGLYEYVINMNMPGMPAGAGNKTIQRCMTASDVEGNKAIEIPPMPDSDCKINNEVVTSSQFSYRIACTTPQKLDGDVKGTMTATSLTMNMTMRTPELPGAITQSIAAHRIGDCK